MKQALMPTQNCFRHQAYSADPPIGAYEMLNAPIDPPADSKEFTRRIREVAQRLADHHVDEIVIVHGTFFGDDALGLFTELERYAPTFGRKVRTANKFLKDSIVGYRNNFTLEYADRLKRLLRTAGHPHIRVRRWHWSSGNHHVARADGAVRLLNELLDMPAEANAGTLLWGHSHAGNVFALITNLLCSPPDVVEQFFAAAEPFYRGALGHRADLPYWEHLRRRLADGVERPRLLVANFGTPVRYGWDIAGCERLVHFVYHVPNPELPEYRVAFPPTWDDLAAAAAGDVVQQGGIAGSDSPPNRLRVRTRRAHQQLGRLLEANLDDSYLERLKTGMRVAEDGLTLLLNYEHYEKRFLCSQFGHAVYTHPVWMLFHAEETARRLCP
ncbi:MAG: hypothetical protein KDA63_17460 [Planctomycetales bacterium]|nr:hypothetical protein [Planctomycetales bacterium]